MPTNRLIARLRATTQARWSVLAAVFLVPFYLGGAYLAVKVAESGHHQWLYLPAACWIWNAMKFAAMAVIHPLRILGHRVSVATVGQAESAL